MTDYATADLHFSHEAVRVYADRPFKNVDQMDRKLIQNINDKVKPDDRLYILGDFAMWGPEKGHHINKLSQRIKCRKILILGNHDKIKPFKYIDYGFESVHTSLTYRNEEILMAHDPSLATVWPREKPMFCGHVHGLFQQIDNVINVGVDVWDYQPVKIKDILELAEQYTRKKRDWIQISEDRHKGADTIE